MPKWCQTGSNMCELSATTVAAKARVVAQLASTKAAEKTTPPGLDGFSMALTLCISKRPFGSGRRMGPGVGRRHWLEVLTKSSLVLLTAIWEAYCEDVAAEALEHLIENSGSPDTLPKEIKQLVAKELKAESHELAVWRPVK